MSDNTRESFTDQTGSTLKPDQQKTTTEKARDTVRGKADSAVSALQPESQKSTSQKAGDKLTGSGDKSMMDKAKDTVGLGNK